MVVIVVVMIAPWSRSSTPSQLASAVPQAPVAREWVERRDVSKLNDSPQYFAWIKPEGEHKDSYGSEIDPSLIIRCMDRHVEVEIDAGRYIGGIGEGTLVTVRFDGGKATRERWSPSDDQKGTFSPNAKRFLKQLAGADRVIIRLQPEYLAGDTFEFRVKHPADRVREVAKACRWNAGL